MLEITEKNHNKKVVKYNSNGINQQIVLRKVFMAISAFLVQKNIQNYLFSYIDISDMVRYEDVLYDMKKARREATFSIPENVKDLIPAVSQLQIMKSFYRGGFEADDGSVGLIFIRDEMKKHLKTAKHLLGDGTYEILPRNPPFAQLYIISFRISDTVTKFKKILIVSVISLL